MTKKLATFTMMFVFLFCNIFQIQIAQGVDVQLKCANSLVNIGDFGHFKCVESERRNISEWQVNTNQKDLTSWNFDLEKKLREYSNPNNVCVKGQKSFDQCISKQKRKFILLIGDSQIRSAVNILSFTGTKKPVIVSLLSGCPPLLYGSIEKESMYGSICIEANKSRISDEIYNKISSVMIMSAGRYTPSDLDQYLNLLETYKIKNIIFIGPYVRSLNSLGDYLSKNETEQLVESNYEFNPLPLFNTINPKSIEFNPSFYEPVTKKHKILFINPLKDFCGENCPLFLEGWPLLVDTHHWSFNFAAQIYNRNYISISDWVSRA